MLKLKNSLENESLRISLYYNWIERKQRENAFILSISSTFSIFTLDHLFSSDNGLFREFSAVRSCTLYRCHGVMQFLSMTAPIRGRRIDLCSVSSIDLTGGAVRKLWRDHFPIAVSSSEYKESHFKTSFLPVYCVLVLNIDHSSQRYIYIYISILLYDQFSFTRSRFLCEKIKVVALEFVG